MTNEIQNPRPTFIDDEGFVHTGTNGLQKPISFLFLSTKMNPASFFFLKKHFLIILRRACVLQFAIN